MSLSRLNSVRVNEGCRLWPLLARQSICRMTFALFAWREIGERRAVTSSLSSSKSSHCQSSLPDAAARLQPPAIAPSPILHCLLKKMPHAHQPKDHSNHHLHRLKMRGRHRRSTVIIHWIDRITSIRHKLIRTLVRRGAW
jgi:hypothetical protein